MNVEVELPSESTRASYARALQQYLLGHGEPALSEAYVLGRRAVSEGFGLLDWAAIHHGALATLAPQLRSRAAMERAATFFAESLSPFEMTHQGYVEANEHLQRLNARLELEADSNARLAEQLKETNAELEAFSYSVAHDLRAPVRRADSFISILVEDYGSALPQDAHHCVNRLRAAVGTMGSLIDGLMSLARMSRAEPERDTVDVSGKARTIVDGLKQTDPNRQVEVDIEENMTAQADGRLVEVVLENLLGNAWKFTGKRVTAHIAVRMDRKATPPVFCVKDDGAGFDSTRSSKLFSPFQRFHAQDAFAGTGIGLATVQRIIRRHGGRIWAESQVDAGATFYFTLAPPPKRPKASA